MKKIVALLMTLSVLVTGFNLPIVANAQDVATQEEEQEQIQDDNEIQEEGQQKEEVGEQEEANSISEDDIEENSETDSTRSQSDLKENSWRYQNGELITGNDDGIAVQSDGYHWNATRKGIDVSQHNGYIDWEQVKASGIDYAIIRCGYGDDYSFQDDSYWQRNVSECERLGIPFGVYIYSYATDVTMAQSEARHVLRLIAGHYLSYPVYFDMEDNSTLGSDFGAIAQTFCNMIQNSGYAVGVYANLNWWNNYLTNSCFENWYRWVAQYNVACDYSGNYAMWQYSDNGAVPGISSRVDMNYLIGSPADHGKALQAGINYQTHVSDIGWKGINQNGETAGSIEQNKGIEAIQINLKDVGNGSVEYRTYVQDIGWQDYVKDGEVSGTLGRAKSVEAIAIQLTGDVASQYDVYYRVYSNGFGWLGWAKNGENAGTQGYAKKVEAIQIQLVAKNGAAPGETSNAFYESSTYMEYQTHVSDIGWQNYVRYGEIAGTTGQNKGVEAFRIKFSYLGNEGIEYRAHVQDIGWQDYVSSGEMIGTTGRNKPIEAISIRLTGEAAEKYDIYYRVHSSDFGWLGWAKNGENAGTQGYAKKVEAIQIQLVAKNELPPGSTLNAFHNSEEEIRYQAHVSDIGWQNIMRSGDIAGTTGQNKGLEAIKINLAYLGENAIEYRAHVQDIGWQQYVTSGQLAGTTGRNKPIEAISIRLTGEAESKYDIYYRIHSSDFGWLGWAKNGENAGTQGYAKKAEAIEIRLVEKDSEAPGSTENAFVKK